jgi:transposase
MDLLHRRCAGLDVHQATVVACARWVTGRKVNRETGEFGTAPRVLLALGDWLRAHKVTHVIMEATGVYWKPVWHVLAGAFELVLANATAVRNVPGRKSDVSDAAWVPYLLPRYRWRREFSGRCSATCPLLVGLWRGANALRCLVEELSNQVHQGFVRRKLGKIIAK